VRTPNFSWQTGQRNANQEVTTVLGQIDQMRAVLAAWTATLSRRVGDDDGQTAAEYIGVIALIAAIVIVLVANGGSIGDTIISGVTTMIEKVVSDGGA
jgi:hypothetical protein